MSDSLIKTYRHLYTGVSMLHEECIMYRLVFGTKPFLIKNINKDMLKSAADNLPS